MPWTILFDERAKKEIKKLPHAAQRQIEDYLRKRIIPADDPTIYAKPMTGNYAGLWRFRVDKYRLIFEINKKTITIIILKVGKRDKVYDT